MQFLTPLHNLVQGILADCSMLNCEKRNLREQPCNLRAVAGLFLEVQSSAPTVKFSFSEVLLSSQSLADAFQTVQGQGHNAAESYLERLRQHNRYQRDVWY